MLNQFGSRASSSRVATRRHRYVADLDYNLVDGNDDGVTDIFDGDLDGDDGALSMTTPGGVVVTASCSHAMKRHEFESIVGQASQQVGRPAWFLEMTGASPDHPVRAGLPETDYLKCAYVSVE